MIVTDNRMNYLSIDRYPEAVGQCNEYMTCGIKNSYKYVNVHDYFLQERKIKKRNCNGKRFCDKYGDMWDEELKTITDEYECDYEDIDCTSKLIVF